MERPKFGAIADASKPPSSIKRKIRFPVTFTRVAILPEQRSTRAPSFIALAADTPIEATSSIGRITFRRATVYRPMPIQHQRPGSHKNVHYITCRLLCIFCSPWRSIEAFGTGVAHRRPEHNQETDQRLATGAERALAHPAVRGEPSTTLEVHGSSRVRNPKSIPDHNGM